MESVQRITGSDTEDSVRRTLKSLPSLYKWKRRNVLNNKTV